MLVQMAQMVYKIHTAGESPTHGWPSTQAELKTEAEAHLAEASQAEFISLFHQITRACI